MPPNIELILLVENDPEICDMISRQALQPLGYRVRVVPDASKAIQQVIKFTPDLIISDIKLMGLSGKDLIVALNSQGLHTPFIVIAKKGEENEVIQAFRLGADDYLLWPARDTEVVSVVERNLHRVRENRSRQKLDIKLKEVNQESERRVRELTTFFAIGKAVPSIRDQSVLLNKLVEGAVELAKADYGWLLLLNKKTGQFELATRRKLPDIWTNRFGKTLNDGISLLVARSGETLVINGVPLKQSMIANLGQSAAFVPIKIDKKVVGLLVIVRVKNIPVELGTQSILEAVADYIAISLVNAHLFRALKEAANSAQTGENHNLELLEKLRADVQVELEPINNPIELLLSGRMGMLTIEQQQAIIIIKEAFQRILIRIGSIGQPPVKTKNGK